MLANILPSLSSPKDNKNKMINHQRTPTPYEKNKTKGLYRHIRVQLSRQTHNSMLANILPSLSSPKDNKNKMINHQRTPTPYEKNKTKGLYRPKAIPIHSTSKKMQKRSKFE